MRQTRQPSAGPSAKRSADGTRRNPQRRAPDPNSWKGQIIDLAGGDDVCFGRPRKRQRVDLGLIDLTEPEAGPSRPVHRAPPAAQRKDIRPLEIARNARTNSSVRQADVRPAPANAMHAEDDAPPAYAPMEVATEPPAEDFYLAHVLEVVPDVQPDHAMGLVRKYITDYGSEVANNVVHMLFEDPSYPKVERNKGKRKRDADDDGPPPKVAKTVDYGSTNRPFTGGAWYYQMAVDQLTLDFPLIPKPYLRLALNLNKNFYAPTYLRLDEESKRPIPPYKVKAAPSRPLPKVEYHDTEFELEREWLLQKLRSEAPEDDGECEDGIECGCCFSNYAFDKMVQCPDAHLFCISCMTSYVKDRLGQHDPHIRCMDQSGCKILISDHELKRFLPEKLLSLYERVKQAKEIEAAGLDGLEDCPFCEFKVVIDNDEEKLFRCQNEECGVISCRACKKVDHLPKSCKEAEEEKGLDARHKVEEAMTEAIMRKCPKCQKPFVKDYGCNKMTCPHCHTLSCYICREIIHGYDHFDESPSGRKQRSSPKKCALWDKVEERHEQEAAAAREKAIKQVKTENPDLDKKELEVELPKVHTGPAVGPAAQVRRGIVHHHQQDYPLIFPPDFNFPPAHRQQPAREPQPRFRLPQPERRRQPPLALPPARLRPPAPLVLPPLQRLPVVFDHHPPVAHAIPARMPQAAANPHLHAPGARMPVANVDAQAPHFIHYHGPGLVGAGAAAAAVMNQLRPVVPQLPVIQDAQLALRQIQQEHEAQLVRLHVQQQQQQHIMDRHRAHMELALGAVQQQQQFQFAMQAQAVPEWGAPQNMQQRRHR